MQTSPDFNFSCSSTAINSPYATAPSSPRPFGHPDEYFYCYTSAPSSPGRAAAIYSLFDANNIDERKERPMSQEFIKEFEFGLSLRGHEEVSTGRIKPSKPKQSPLPLKSPRSDLVSPTAAVARESRSLPPIEDRELVEAHKAPIPSPSTSASAAAGSSVKKSRSKKWRLKDLLLFRSASEGRATGRGSKDPLRKYTLLSTSFSKNRQGEHESGKSIGSARSLDSSHSFMKRSPISAHELHYTANRAAAEEQKKRTPLPFHQNSFFGYLHFNTTVRSIRRGFNSYSFNQGRP